MPPSMNSAEMPELGWVSGHLQIIDFIGDRVMCNLGVIARTMELFCFRILLVQQLKFSLVYLASPIPHVKEPILVCPAALRWHWL